MSQRKVKNDTNNNTRDLPTRHGSHGNLIASQPNLRDDLNGTLRSMHLSDEPEKRGLIKRTKSFWKFGRNGSDEILEGMSMWKHRDLVDVVEQEKKAESPKTTPTRPKSVEKVNYNRTASSERSNDSDKTLKEKHYEESSQEIYGTTETPKRRTPSFKGKQKLSLPARRDSDSRNEIDYEETFEKPPKIPIDDQFYDDDGDGLMRTVNRKSILQQYKDDSTGAETDESESDDITSDDPYDCIVVDDHTTTSKQRKQQQQQQQQRNGEVRKEKYPNVAEIGKKLEKLSKSNKYATETKEKNEELRRDEYRNSMNNKMNKMTAYNNDKNLEKSPESEPQEEEIKLRRYNGNANRNGQQIRSPSPAQRHSFKTFGIPSNERPEKVRHQSENSPPEPEMHPKPRYLERKHQENYEKSEEKRVENDRRDKVAYYQERRDEYGEENNEKRQFLPRTKLVKTNSTMQTVMKFEHEIGVIDYDEAVRGKMKKPDYEDIENTGNVYGPWYDLWGLDATVKK